MLYLCLVICVMEVENFHVLCFFWDDSYVYVGAHTYTGAYMLVYIHNHTHEHTYALNLIMSVSRLQRFINQQSSLSRGQVGAALTFFQVGTQSHITHVDVHPYSLIWVCYHHVVKLGSVCRHGYYVCVFNNNCSGKIMIKLIVILAVI